MSEIGKTTGMNTDPETVLEPVDCREMQRAELTILDRFMEVCGKYHLRYYLNAGTLLGAVRHRGFIPWDDDIDVCMPRSDYDQFLEYAPGELDGRYRLVWFDNQAEGEHPQYYCQIQDTGYPVVQMIAQQARETCAWIDVFPMDGMPENRILRKIHSLLLLYYRARIQASMFDRNVNIHKKGRPLHERVIIRMITLLKWGTGGNTYRLMEKLDRLLKRYPPDDSGLWINFMGAYKTKEMFPAEVYGPGSKLEFEGRECAGPVRPDVVLTRLYGDYMTPVKPSSAEEGHRLFRRKQIGD